MFARYSREELLSVNQRAPSAITHSTYSRLRWSGLCIYRPTKRSRKRRRLIAQQQQQQLANLCLLNARSILNKSEALSELFNDVQPDVVAITETWLTPTHGDRDLAACCPPGFSAVHAPRSIGRGGGVALIFKTTIAVRRHAHSAFDSFELLDCSLSFRTTSIRLLVVYRPPSSLQSVFREEFSSLLEQIALSNEKLLIVGDFNLCIRDKPDDTALKFLDITDAFGLSQLVESATHESGSTLDLVFARTSDDLVRATSVLGFFSDHCCVLTALSCCAPRFPSKQLSFRRLRDVDPDAFATDIDSLSILTNPSDTLDCLVTQYNDGLRSLIDRHAPLVTKNVVLRPSAPWIGDSIRQSKREMRRAERIWKKHRLSVYREIYRDRRRRHNNLLTSERSSYVSSKVAECSGDSKKLFSLVNSLMGTPTTPAAPKRDSDAIAAAEIADFYDAKIIKIRSGLDAAAADAGLPAIQPFAPSPVDVSSPSLASFRQLTTSDVRKLIISSPNKSCRLDPIPTVLLKRFIDKLVVPITTIVNLSLLSGFFPSNLKHAVISPILKKSSLDPDAPDNYRPVSNLPFLSKLLERAVFAQLSEHLSRHTLLPDRQSAYRPNYSTETALLSLRNDMLLAADAGHGSAVVLLDLSAAFDTIDHGVLLDRLNTHCGLIGPALSWFSSYLSGRTQAVVVGSAVSHTTNIRYGVPQGSVLGGTLFTIYVCQLPSVTATDGVTIDGFSDDTQARIRLSLGPNGSLSSHPTTPLASLSAWCLNCERFFLTNRVKLNIGKTVYFLAAPKNRTDQLPSLPLTIGATSIPPVSQCVNLGVTFDSQLSMELHVKKASRSAFYHLRLIARIRRFLNLAATKTLVHAFVLSRMDYCNSLLAGLPDKTIACLQRVQNAAARLTLRRGRLVSSSSLLKELKWLPVKQRIIFKAATLAFRCRLSPPLAPRYLSSLLSSHAPTRSLRSSTTISLAVPRVRLSTYGERSFAFLAPTLLNSLPSAITSTSTVTSFKSKLKAHLLCSAFPQ